MKIITYLNKDTNEAQDLTMQEAIAKMRQCFQYPKSNEQIFKDIQHLMNGELVQSAHHGFARIDDQRMKPSDEFESYITEEEAFEAYKHEPGLYATTAIEHGEFGARECVKILGEDNRQIAVLHPRRAYRWVKHFNVLVAQEKGAVIAL